jgi:hypothetical protein
MSLALGNEHIHQVSGSSTKNQACSPASRPQQLHVHHSSSFEQVNISEWLFTLSDKEYQQCSVSHIACGSSRAADGRRMSLIEEIGGSLTVQHYVEDIAEKQHCRSFRPRTCLQTETAPPCRWYGN